MNLHYFQHVHFEGLGYIGEWADRNGVNMTRTAFFNDFSLPEIEEIDWLIVMGGSMGIDEDKKYPWLVDEKKQIEKAISHDKIVIGICLGAQLIADVLGAKVTKNNEKEIGWYPVNIKKESIFSEVPEKINSFHWHGDTFDIPAGANHIAGSDACLNQGFTYNRDKVIALQFHMEIKKDGIVGLVENCAEELVSGRYIQTPEEILDCDRYLSENNKNMSEILSKILSGNGSCN